MDEWSCAVSEQPGKITVGDIFSVSCQGEKPENFNTDSLRIAFPQKEHDFRLYVLEGSQPDPHSLDLQAVSYRTGEFSDIPFVITDGKASVRGKDLSFSVQSVVKPGAKIQTHPPFGPWASPQSIGRTAWQLATILLFLAAAAFFLQRLFQRRKFIGEVIARRETYKGISPGTLFIRSIRGKAAAAPDFAPALARLFRIFLEDALFVPAAGRPPALILKSLKKFHRSFSKNRGGTIASFLAEIDRRAAQKGRPDAKDEDALRDLRDRCIQFTLEAEEEAR